MMSVSQILEALNYTFNTVYLINITANKLEQFSYKKHATLTT